MNSVWVVTNILSNNDGYFDEAIYGIFASRPAAVQFLEKANYKHHVVKDVNNRYILASNDDILDECFIHCMEVKD